MACPLRILYLNPFGGQSHHAFVEAWSQRSGHRFSVLSLPAVHWKWRSRHSALTFAIQAEALARSSKFDVVFATSMLDLPSWRGLVSPQLAQTPTVVYFHENQLTYPLAAGQARDYHFAYSNMLSARVATQVWFNSMFHQQEFLTGLEAWLRRMPDNQHLESVQLIKAKSRVRYPGVDVSLIRQTRETLSSEGNSSCADHRGPIIGWVSRWEHDKAPERFVSLVQHLQDSGLRFRLCLLGQQFDGRNEWLHRVHAIAGDKIVHSGYAATREEYVLLLSQMDIVVSTANHEYFGIGIQEAIAAGAFPVLPRRLAYPEVLGLASPNEYSPFLYCEDSSADRSLTAIVEELVKDWPVGRHAHREALQRLQGDTSKFDWAELAKSYDAFLMEIAQSTE